MPFVLALRNCAMRYTAQIQMKIQIHPSIRPLAASHDRLTQAEQRTRSVSRVSPCQTWCWGGSFLLQYRPPLVGFFKPSLYYSEQSTLPLLHGLPLYSLLVKPAPSLRSILREPSKTFGSTRNIVHICKDRLLQRGFGQDRLQLRCSKKIWSEAIIVMLISAGRSWSSVSADQLLSTSTTTSLLKTLATITTSNASTTTILTSATAT